jgi:deoxyribonuclease V
VSRSMSWSVEVDLKSLVLDAIGQIPRGRVSTYGDVAMAMGDIRAARAVGTIMAEDPESSPLPCHRVVYSDGHVGNQGGHGKGAERNAELLRSEGVKVEDDRVDLVDHFTDFQVRPMLEELAREQEDMRGSVVEEDDFEDLERVAGFDVAYSGDQGFGCLVVYDLESMRKVEVRTVQRRVRFPYIPGYLGYRESPIAQELIAAEEEMIYLIDGQGRLHPRGFGIACHIGVSLGVPTVGAAKSLLLGKVGEETEGRAPIAIDGKLAGYRLRPSGRAKVYVSVGHRVSLETSVELCRRLMVKGVPEPQRQAHMGATEMRRKYQSEACR